MDTGFETIGNATLIAYDKVPVLVTDPWVVGDAYFGSWTLQHQVPEAQMEAIKKCEFVWVSHGHPDHLSIQSLRLLKEKSILLPNHVGGRIADDLNRLGFKVSVLPDRKWVSLSPRIKVVCIPDYNQDAVLLVDVAGTLLVDLNDASPRGWGPFVQKTAREYKDSFLLQLNGYGDADMINFFDDNGARIEPLASLKLPVGKSIARVADAFGVRYVIPFSSMHKYQRADSVWANQYTTPLGEYRTGFNSRACELLPAYMRFDSTARRFDEIKPPPILDSVVEPKEFGDDWSECLEAEDIRKLNAYFRPISHLGKVIDFINVRVGGVDNIIELRNRNFEKGIVFEVPRRSLMRAIRYEVFDDLLIGNFMKTRVIGKWSRSILYPDFEPFVAKYADNGRAKSPEELKEYFREYRKRAPIDYLRHRIQCQLATVARTRLDSNSELYLLAKKSWWFINRWLGP